MWTSRLLAAALVLLGVLVPAHAVGASLEDAGRVVPARIHDRAQAEGEVRVLVELALPSGRRAEGALRDRGRIAYRQEIADTGARVLSRLARHPHRVLRRYLSAPLIALQVGPPGLSELEASGVLVKRVMEDRIHRPVLWDSVPIIGGDQAWAQGFDGTGLVVAVLDSGVDAAHPFLAGKVVEEACYSTRIRRRSASLCPNGADEQIGPGAAAPCSPDLEGCWHGTHVAGIAAGDGTPYELPLWGVGRGARIMAVQVFSRFTRASDCGGVAPCLGAYTSDILAGLERVYVLRTTHTFAAVNLSLGGGLFGATCDDEPYKPFIDNLRAVGIATIVASGNSGATDQLSAPACVSTAVSVGATTKADQVAYFSNVAPFLSLFAPGDEIISSFAGGDFAMASGTSMAAPHVTGAWAVLKQAVPSAGVDEVLQALDGTGVMIEDTRAGTGTTRPRIQVDLALAALLNPGAPIVARVSPDRAVVGTSLTVTVGGLNFEPGASASLGPGVTVTSTTVVSSRELAVAVAIDGSAAAGPRDVSVTNPGGQTGTRPGAFTVLPPPPTLGLEFVGRVRDRVGGSSSAFAPDGAADGVFRAVVDGGIWPRTVTRLELRRTGSIDVWDTDPATVAWALGAAAGLDGALLNAGNGTVSFPVADDGEIFLFASDYSPTPFASGAVFTLAAEFADGTSATATVTLPTVPTISGVSPSSGVRGANLTVTVTGTDFQAGATAAFGAGITVTSTTVVSSTQLSVALAIETTAAVGPRDVTVTNPDGQAVVRAGGFTVQPAPPALALTFLGKVRDRVGTSSGAFAPDGALDPTFQVTLEAGSGARTVTHLELRRTGTASIWDSNTATVYWALGAAATLDSGLLNAGDGTVSFPVAEGGTFVLFASDASPTPFESGASFMVTATFADGTSAAATVTLPLVPSISSVSPSSGVQGASLTVTLAGARFAPGASAAFGTGTTVASTTVVSSTELSVALTIAAGAAPGPRDVTVTNPDGQSGVRTGGFTVHLPPPTLALAYLGKLRDRVGTSSGAFAPDGALDATFQVTVEAGGPRTVTHLELRRTGTASIWDSNTASVYWALGAAATLDGGLLNAGDGTVSFPVAEGGTFVLFASDASPTPFESGASFTVTASFADGTSATAGVTLPVVPTITSVAPTSGAPGATLTVTVTGADFQPGASAAFGAGITVASTTVVSSTQLSVALAIETTAAVGPRDVTVTNPGGLSGVRAGGFTVAQASPTLGLAFLGKLRDRVGTSSGAFAPDGALDATFQVTLQAGSGPRTVTHLELRRTGTASIWDSSTATVYWALGAAATLDGALLNAGDGTVSFPAAEGGTFVLFASDASPTPFVSGASFTVTASFADGTSATASVTLPAVPTISGVSPSSGVPGGSLTVTVTGTSFQAGASAAFGAGITVISTTVVSSTELSVALTIAAGAAAGPRDVTVTNPDGQAAIRAGGFTVVPPAPTLGLAFLGKIRDRVGTSSGAFAPDGALDAVFRVSLEAGSGSRAVTHLELRRTGTGSIWDSNTATVYWALGAAADLDGALLNAGDGTVSFPVADGGTFVLFASDASPTPFVSGAHFTVTVSFADGTSTTATVTLPVVPTISGVSPSSGVQGESLAVTVTGANFQAGASAAFGAGITVTSTTVDSSTQLSVALAIEGTAAAGPRDVTVTNPDGQLAIGPGAFTVKLPPPALALAFLGTLGDRVGKSTSAFAPDGGLDGTFQVTVVAGSGARTVTRLELRRLGSVDLWDANSATPPWALGAAATLDSPLLNAGNGTVNFAVAVGGTFVLFASDYSPSPFVPGMTFSLTATFADGSVVTVTTTIP